MLILQKNDVASVNGSTRGMFLDIGAFSHARAAWKVILKKIGNKRPPVCWWMLAPGDNRP
jgi:hypothetical protein